MYRESNYFMPENTGDPITPAGSYNGPASSSLEVTHKTLLERLTEASPALICLFNGKLHRFEYVSPNMKSMFGYSHELFVGEALQEMTELVHFADREMLTRAEALFNETLSHFPASQRKDVKSIMNFRIRRSDGSIAWVQQQKTVFETNDLGEPVLMMSVITDISVTRKCHEFFSSIVYRDASKGWVELGAEDVGQQLSNREAQILAMLSKGKSSKIIADELSISVNTVNNHRKNMLLKTGTNNIAELVSYSLSQGLI